MVTEVDSLLHCPLFSSKSIYGGPRQFSVLYELHVVSILDQARSLEDPSSLFFSIATCHCSLHRISQDKPMAWSLF